MSNVIVFKIDGVEVKGKAGQTIMDAADEAGIYLPGSVTLRAWSPREAAVSVLLKSMADQPPLVLSRLLRE